MADPTQTPSRGDWACPCSGCQKAVAWERKQIIAEIDAMMLELPLQEVTGSQIIEMIQDRMPKPKAKK
jgi:hypothetical protein